MSRIETALAKLQRAREIAGKPESEQPLGRVVARELGAGAPIATPALGPREHAYRKDRFIQVNVGALRNAGLLAPANYERRLLEEYRLIKRPLLANAAGTGAAALERPNLIMLGSAVPGEGKTFTCINLCLSLARERDWTVVLVDGDVAKPHLTQLFGLRGEPGFMDLMHTAGAVFEDYVFPTDVPGLALLPAGNSDPQAAELLASAQMDALAQHLADSDPRRLVVFDSPPLLATSEAPVLASQVGQVVLVVRAGYTPRQRVQQAIEKIDSSKALNLVLNQAAPSADIVSYGEQYGYGYGD